MIGSHTGDATLRYPRLMDFKMGRDEDVVDAAKRQQGGEGVKGLMVFG
jgi:hypothetical protein